VLEALRQVAPTRAELAALETREAIEAEVVNRGVVGELVDRSGLGEGDDAAPDEGQE